MSEPRLAFLAAETEAARGARARLADRYGETDPDVADAIVALGGDGFMLETQHRFLGQNRPVYGMNCGSVGFLMNEHREEDLPQRVGAAQAAVLHPLRMRAETVIAGHQAAVDRAVALAKERGARRATLLAVSAPFHSPLMRPAREGMAPLLAAAELRDPRVPVVTNVDAAPATTGAAARQALLRQIDSPVRWAECVLLMERALGVEVFVEVGPGNVLSGLNRRIVEAARATPVSDPEHLRQLMEEG